MNPGERLPNLLELVLTEGERWDHVLRNDREYFTSPDFMRHCSRVESRIMTRCVGLVEIENCHRPITEDLSDPVVLGLRGYTDNSEVTSLDDPDHSEQDTRRGIVLNVFASSNEQNPYRHLGSVQMIHRTVKDFLLTHHGELFQLPEQRLAAAVALVRGKLGVMNLIPILVDRARYRRTVLTFFDYRVLLCKTRGTATILR